MSPVPPQSGPPVIILGGNANTLSVARTLGARGVRVFSVGAATHLGHSRYITALDVPAPKGDEEEAWAAYLLGPRCRHLEGAILLACSDEGLTVIAHHREALAERFLLDLSNPTAQLAMLDKLAAYRIAETAGVPTPRFWCVGSAAEIDAVAAELVYPLLVKPLLSHVYQKQFGGRKFSIANSIDEVHALFGDVSELGIEVMLVERIPGPDSLLCSYYTYLDESGEPQFHLTKRSLRSFPVSMGNCTLHMVDRVPGVGDLARRLFAAAGLLGVANAEFKLDERDGVLKLIECNARFTAGNPVVLRSGPDIARFVYDRLTGGSYRFPADFRPGVRMWVPGKDLLALRAMRGSGDLTVAAWLRSLAHRQLLPIFSLRDPGPSLANARSAARALARRRSRTPDSASDPTTPFVDQPHGERVSP